MSRIYLIAGHTIKDGVGTGAKSSYGDEAVEAAKLRDEIHRNLLKNGYLNVVTDPNTTKLGDLCRKLKSLVTKRDLVVDIHFNAATPKATGTEVFIDDTPTSSEIVFASNLAAGMSKVLGIRNRGVKKENQTRHGSLGIISIPSSATNVLLEVCFLTNKKDMASYRNNFKELARELACIISNQARIN